jgi:excisionase family DNA binding protein
MRVMMNLPAVATNQDNDRQFYTVPEAALLLQVSQATVWRWIEAGKLPAYRVGPRRIRIQKQDLITVIQPVQRREVAVVKEEEVRTIWANYDPQRVCQALKQSAGALAGVDRQALLEDIHVARKQDSNGRPA